MRKNIISLVALLLVNSTASATIKAGTYPFVDDYSIASPEANRILYFSPDKDKPIEVTFTINKLREVHNIGLQSDTLTINCNGVISLVKSGQTGTCLLAKGQQGYVFIADADFINGNDGITSYKELA